MQYLQLSFPISETEFSAIEAILDRAGALSVTTMDAEDKPILEPKPGETPLWAQLIVTALFPENKNQAKIERALHIALGERPFTWQILAEQNWERAWLKDYEPIQFDNRLWVGPQDFSPPPAMNAVLFLDPGLAFGTGTHPTTYLCLEWLSRQNLQGKTLLDFGCGSGILALAALKLGASSIIGIDIDPQALDASEENAARNNIDPKQCTWLLPNQSLPIPVDIVLANVLANPLIELAQDLLSRLKSHGLLVLSGILAEQAETVKTAYRPYIEWLEIAEQEGWIRLVGKAAHKV